MPVIPIINKDTADIVRYLESKIDDPARQRTLVLVIVCVVLLLDNMLYMVIVPIIPIYLEEIKGGCRAPKVAGLYFKRECEYLPYEEYVRNFTVNRTDPHLHNYTIEHLFPLITYHGRDPAEDAAVGFLFASKAIVQLFFSPFAGTVIDRFGYDRPMLFGLSVLFVSTAIFAFGSTYGVLFMARSLQGVGSAFADTSGLAMIADRFKEDTARTKAQGIALAFISFGCLFAPPFGGILYEYAGKAVPFLILALVALVDGLLLRFVLTPERQERAEMARSMSNGGLQRQMSKSLSATSHLSKAGGPKPASTPIYKLILDPYIALCAGALVMANVSLAFLEPTIALWMEKTFLASEVQIGMVWLPAFFPHVLGVFVTVKLAQRYPTKQWLITAVGLCLEGFSCLLVPFCSSYGAVIIPLMIDCFGIALVDTAILPTLAYLVDVRHTSVYGSVYAIADVSYSLAYAFGPIVAGGIMGSYGFTAMNVGIFVSNVVYAPMLILLKNIYKYKPFEEDLEDDTLVGGGGINGRQSQQQYMTYHMSDMGGGTTDGGTNGSIKASGDYNAIYGGGDQVTRKEPAEKSPSFWQNGNGSGGSKMADNVRSSTYYRADSLATNQLAAKEPVEPVITPRTAIYISRD